MATKRGGSNGRQSRLAGRDNKSGELRTVEYARQHPSSTTVEHLPLPGFGDVKPHNKPKKGS